MIFRGGPVKKKTTPCIHIYQNLSWHCSILWYLLNPRYLVQEQFNQLVDRPTHIAGGELYDLNEFIRAWKYSGRWVFKVFWPSENSIPYWFYNHLTIYRPFINHSISQIKSMVFQVFWIKHTFEKPAKQKQRQFIYMVTISVTMTVYA